MTLVKILFLVEDEDYTDVESLWAESLRGDLYQLRSVPALVEGVAWGDRVRGECANDSLWFKEVVARSGYGTVWVKATQPEATSAVRATCKTHEIMTETLAKDFLALAVPPGLTMALLVEELEALSNEGLVDYEVACPSIP